MNSAPLISDTVRARPRSLQMVELVGPAGSGKTALAHALSQSSGKIVVADDISLRKKEHLLILLQNVSSLLPILTAGDRSRRSFTWDDIKSMVYLKGWFRLLRQQVAKGDIIVLLDHGPIFKLATFYAFGPERLRSEAFEQWWNQMFNQWAFRLNMVVWLDAPDPVLEHRINGRNQRHAVKGKSELEVREFLERYRISYEQMLAKLTVNGRPTLFQFDTSQTSIEQIAENVLDACKVKTIGI